VVVDDLDCECIAGFEPETDAPLIVDPNAVLTGSVTSQEFQPIVGWDPQVVDVGRPIQHSQLAHRDCLDIYEAPDTGS
jgi:hypothetical protein